MKDSMDDGEVELSDNGLLSNPSSSSNFQGSTSVNTILDDFLKNTRTCTHTHTCNPPGPDAAHTHTCYHTHTQVFTSEEDDYPNDRERSSLKPKRPLGNREAVRKYREKKKAHTAFLEEEVKKLHLLNQQLVRKLQGQAVLEAEVLRLRSILVDLRGKMDNELGAFPFQRQCNSATIFKDSDSGVQCVGKGKAIGSQLQTNLQCFHPAVSSQAANCGNEKMMASWERNCQPAITDCQANANTSVSQAE
ncbi:Basic leucine zipper like [Quillaja saponaria]|uniref:Basic leucine zipper like n=1 Tax=Quillaja saponaria TaxID=32244 RepID=A0AAD7L121_QUISA|nr:Basic leucine zipper like [Quillaja saponaria]KAJ7949268.1 Basic leucine zipper like [Quillaja saponaria]